MIIKNDPFCVCTRFRRLKFLDLSRTSRLEERLKTRIHHWGFDKNLLSLFEFRMLGICHGLEDNLFYFGFKMVNFYIVLKIENLGNAPDVTKLAPIFSMCRKAENLLT